MPSFSDCHLLSGPRRLSLHQRYMLRKAAMWNSCLQSSLSTWVDVVADHEYQEIGTYSYGRGIFHKPPRSGLEVGDKDLYLLKEGDLILQITFAWEGAIALCSKAAEGFYGSVRYPTYRVNEKCCFAPYLVRYLCTREGLEQINRICPGSAGRTRVLALKRLPELLVPLPPIDEQRRIVRRIEELSSKIEEAQKLRQLA